jgi:AGCS family alanine or glycine:cation symporter
MVMPVAICSSISVQHNDAMILAMVFPNMIGLMFLYPVVKKELNIYLDAINVKKFFK